MGLSRSEGWGRRGKARRLRRRLGEEFEEIGGLQGSGVGEEAGRSKAEMSGVENVGAQEAEGPSVGRQDGQGDEGWGQGVQGGGWAQGVWGKVGRDGGWVQGEDGTINQRCQGQVCLVASKIILCCAARVAGKKKPDFSVCYTRVGRGSRGGGGGAELFGTGAGGQWRLGIYWTVILSWLLKVGGPFLR